MLLLSNSKKYFFVNFLIYIFIFIIVITMKEHIINAINSVKKSQLTKEQKDEIISELISTYSYFCVLLNEKETFYQSSFVFAKYTQEIQRVIGEK